MSTTVGSTTSASSAAASTSGDAYSKLGKNDFLKLLTAQLANQDPTNPVDDKQMIAQLAQFSSLEQMENVSATLDKLYTATSSQTQLSTAGLVGKTVSYASDTVAVASDGSVGAAQVKLPTAATVTATITNGSGRVLRTLNLGAQKAGTFALGWDGKDAGGNAVGAGAYTVTLTAKGSDGSDVAAQLLEKGTVTGVAFDGTATSVLVGNQSIDLASVYQIQQS